MARTRRLSSERRRPRQRQRGDEADAERDERAAADGGELLADVGQRQREADEAERGQRRIRDRHRDIEHVGAHASCCSGARRRCRRGAPAAISGRSPWFSTVASASPSRSESPMTTPSGATSVTRAPTSRGERIGLVVELGAGGGLPVRERFGGQPRLADERALDAFAR